MSKRRFTRHVATAALCAFALAAAATPADAKKIRWKMHAAFGQAVAVLGPVSGRITGMIRDMSDGDFDIKVFEPGALAGG